ncbi:hypothetical protein KP509_15G072200 [Ceratopteris richardii]|uniref:HTH myb-type domain-containing protein n=1 Tax=Ceratopteris richardii TaxID=49495 RepID=A0A8T2T6Y3_CERRI|nr:hypothetical protein KP509_15G072200 [Ceratopteris richardii]
MMAATTEVNASPLRSAASDASDDDDDDDGRNDTVSEWEEALPSLADLISLSQCLISPQLASAFSIPSPCLSSPSVNDVSLASQAIISSLCGIDPTGASKDPNAGLFAPNSCNVSPSDSGHLLVNSLYVEQGRCDGRVGSQYMDREEGVSPVDMNHAGEGDGSYLQKCGNGSQGLINERYRLHEGNSCHSNSDPSDVEVGQGFEGCISTTSMQNSQDFSHEFPGAYEDHGRSSYDKANARVTNASCGNHASDSQLGAIHETEDATEFTPKKPSQDVSARTLKRPRLVWTPELHKRFVDAVTHLGVNTAVPKTIMQLMNVEGLTRENVASHLQKYRIYLKRVQGISGESPMISDHLFRPLPIVGSIATSQRISSVTYAGMQDVNQVPVIAPLTAVPMTRGHVVGIASSFLGAEPFNYSVYTNPQHGLAHVNAKIGHPTGLKHSGSHHHNTGT